MSTSNEVGGREQESLPRDMEQDKPPRASRFPLSASAFGGPLPKYFFLILVCLLFYLPGLFTIPPMDRDEARFAQASKQMVETRDFVRIRFQNAPRDKKPIGIYWLQAASAELSGAAGSRKIWPYRIPSLLGALFSVLLTFAIGKRLFGERTGFLGAILCSSSVLLIVEAHIATTDAVLLVTVLTSQLALSKFYLREDKDKPAGTGAFLTFWIAQAAGILVKGPVTPMIGLLTIGCLTAADRDTRWLKGLRPFSGLAIVAILVSPWMIAIGVDTKGAFFRRSLVGDFLSKVVSGQESHGFPPGSYLLLLPLTLWPASALAGAAVFRAWKSRSASAVRFCLAWVVPAWIVFELVPTKLPHYVMPLYPALCLLVAYLIICGEEGKASELDSKLVRTGYVCCQLVIVLLALGCFALPWFLEHRLDPLGLIPVAAAGGCAVFSTWNFFKRRYLRATAVAVAATALVFGPALQWILPGINSIWLSRSVSYAATELGGKNVKLCSVGYDEPSLVFLVGTKTLLTSAEGAALYLQKNPGALALVDRRQTGNFIKQADNLGLHLRQVGAISGINYSKGRKMLLRFYRAAAGFSHQ